jgi:pimeloyl-ACP methyl ester carboxylesterase
VHIVAHSYGAYVALRLATLHPELVRSLVLAEPPVLGFLGGSPEADSVAAAFRAKALEPSRVAFMRGDSVDGVRRFLDGVSGRAGAFDGMPEQVRKAFLAAAGELRAEMTTPLPEYMTPLTCQQVRLVGKPVLLTQGEQSARMFHLINARLRPCFATADTLTVPRASHGSQVASPVFVDRVRAFLDAH